MPLLTGASHHFFNYDMTIADWDLIENSSALDVSFACLAAANLHYSSYKKLVEGLFFLPISDTPEDSVGTHYRQYSKLVVGPRLTSDCNHDKKDGLDTDENNDGGVTDDRAADDRAADDGAADNKVADDGVADDGATNDRATDDNDGDYTEKQEKLVCLGRGLFLDKTQSLILVTPKKTLLNTLEEDTTRSPILVLPEKTLLDTSENDKSGTVTSDISKKFTQ